MSVYLSISCGDNFKIFLFSTKKGNYSSSGLNSPPTGSVIIYERCTLDANFYPKNLFYSVSLTFYSEYESVSIFLTNELNNLFMAVKSIPSPIPSPAYNYSSKVDSLSVRSDSLTQMSPAILKSVLPLSTIYFANLQSSFRQSCK